MRRLEKALRVAFHKVSDWIEARWRALLVTFKIRGATERLLSEEEYEEAETYRDKNAVELSLFTRSGSTTRRNKKGGKCVRSYSLLLLSGSPRSPS